MEIKRFGDMQGNTIMLLHGNLMCWRQFEDKTEINGEAHIGQWLI